MAEPTVEPAQGELPLLLHSLVLYREVLERCLEHVAPDVLLEIGSEGGQMSQLLAEWAQAHNSQLFSVEPYPSERLLALEDAAGVTVVKDFSPEALTGLPNPDFALVDGDHNHHTVAAELEAILPAAGADPAAGPLVVLHDVGWPCARRDFYYAPERIPEHARRESTWVEGIRPGDPGTGPGGFRGAGGFAVARHEGGGRNGVLTAVDDALATRPELECLVVAPVFGVAFVFPRAAPWADAVRGVVGPLAGAPLLSHMERNRLDLYVRVLDLQDELESQRVRFDRARTALEDDITRAQAEVNRLRERLASRDGT